MKTNLGVRLNRGRYHRVGRIPKKSVKQHVYYLSSEGPSISVLEEVKRYQQNTAGADPQKDLK